MDALRGVGFGEQEAKVYLALLRRGELTGYELAAAAALPRANVYPVLQKLEERGAVRRHVDARGARWAATPPAEVLERTEAAYRGAIKTARQALDRLEVAVPPAQLWSVHGRAAVLAQAGGLVAGARRELLVAIWPAEAAALARDLQAADERGVAITTICLTHCAEPCGGCRGRLYRYPVAPADRQRWLVVVADRAEVLAAELPGDDSAVAVRTRQRLLVELATWYLRHSIAVAALVRDLGPERWRELRPETRQALADAGADPTVAAAGGWWSEMWQLLQSAGPAAGEAG